MNYKYLSSGMLQILNDNGESTGSCSPEHPTFKKWLTEGDTPEAADVPYPMIAIRAERDKRLALADIEILKLEDVGGDTTAYRIYRQALRDIPSEQPDATIEDVSWPTVV